MASRAATTRRWEADGRCAWASSRLGWSWTVVEEQRHRRRRRRSARIPGCACRHRSSSRWSESVVSGNGGRSSSTIRTARPGRRRSGSGAAGWCRARGATAAPASGATADGVVRTASSLFSRDTASFDGLVGGVELGPVPRLVVGRGGRVVDEQEDRCRDQGEQQADVDEDPVDTHVAQSSEGERGGDEDEGRQQAVRSENAAFSSAVTR